MGSFSLVLTLFFVSMKSGASIDLKFVAKMDDEARKQHLAQDVNLPDADSKLDLVLAITQRNLDKLVEDLNQISDPISASYGKYLTHGEVMLLTSNQEATATVKNQLLDIGAEIIETTLGGEFIFVRAPIATWEHFFGTRFYSFSHLPTGTKVVRALEYSLPTNLFDHVYHVFNIIGFPASRLLA